MPGKLKQPKAVPLAVPEPGKDSAERKRVLNVLAQRRYRQRRREHVRKLEAQVGATEPSPGDFQAQAAPAMEIPEKEQEKEQVGGDETFQCQGPFNPAADQLYTYDVNEMIPNQPTEEPSLWDTSILLPSLASTPISSSRNSSSDDSESWSLNSQVGHTIPQQHSVGQEMIYSFPDEAYLEISELNLLRGCMAIARRMNLQDIIWSLTATSPFTDPTTAWNQCAHLPMNLRPTVFQMTIPHHPVLDLLPWPSARDRMIMVLSQPVECRPPSAASPMALLDFVYDIEDSAEGVRISGSDPYSENNWELGEKVFKSWWWAFDRDIVKKSNDLRMLRGAPLLGGSVLGEVS